LPVIVVSAKTIVPRFAYSPQRHREHRDCFSLVIPAQAGTHGSASWNAAKWIPAFAGMTEINSAFCAFAAIYFLNG
jgi:hypothetical protein